MEKQFAPFFNYIRNSINNDFISSLIFLNNFYNFNFFQINSFNRKDIQPNDYNRANKIDSQFIHAGNCIPNYIKPNYVNFFSFENEPKNIINNIYIENDKNKEDLISQKTKNISNFSGEINNKDNQNELNSLKYKDDYLNDNNNISNNNNDDETSGEPVIEINTCNELCENIIDNNIINKELKKQKIKFQNLEIDYAKKFQLFNKGTNNQYVNEIINLINDARKIKKKKKNIFKISNDENEDSVRLIGRKRKNIIKKRFEKPDDIRKKLKSRFHKIFTKKINDNLKSVNSKKKFYSMPQIFISNISKKQNKEVMNMKMRDLFQKNFIEDYKQYITKNIEANNDKYSRNLRTLEYLEKNVDIQEKSKFNIIGEMKYFEILEEFFYSKEFEDTVIAESKKKPFEYVKNYVKLARTYVKFFLYSS